MSRGVGDQGPRWGRAAAPPVAQEWVIAYCPEVPGANGQGRTKDEARESLAAAITLVLDNQDRSPPRRRAAPDQERPPNG